jgi:hypothetical protein
VTTGAGLATPSATIGLRHPCSGRAPTASWMIATRDVRGHFDGVTEWQLRSSQGLIDARHHGTSSTLLEY